MKPNSRFRFHGPAVAAFVAAALAVPLAHAALFADDEARRAIIDLRQRLEQSNEQQRARQAEQTAQLTEQLNQLKRSLLDLNNHNINKSRNDQSLLHQRRQKL